MIKLGQRVRDKVTGLEGIVIAGVEYPVDGRIQFCVELESVDGKTLEGEYIDDGQLEFVDAGVTIEDVADPGGTMPDTPATRYSD